jgi:hypothetical protein
MITEKNTKKEILAAYNEAIKNGAASLSPGAEAEKSRTDRTLQLNTDGVMQFLDDMKHKILSQNSIVEDLQRAIGAKKNELEEIYEIEAIAGGAVEAIEKHEKAMAELKEKEKKSQQEYNDLLAANARQAQLNGQEYEREHSIKVSEMTRELHEKRQDLERELVLRKREVDDALRDRESRIDEIMAELETLRVKVEGFPLELEAACDEAAAEAKRKADASNSYQVRELKKDIESKESNNSIVVAALDRRIADLTEENLYLKEKLEQASDKVNEIANTSIMNARPEQVIKYMPAEARN